MEDTEIPTQSPVPRVWDWSAYPKGTKAPAINGGYWIRVTLGWKWFNGDTFPQPGGDSDGTVMLPCEY